MNLIKGLNNVYRDNDATVGGRKNRDCTNPDIVGSRARTKEKYFNTRQRALL